MGDRQYFNEICDFCDIKLKRPFDYEAHILGERHRYEVKREILKEQYSSSLHHRPRYKKYGCALCFSEYYGAKSYYTHLITSHPREPVGEANRHQYEDTEINVCRLCNIELRGHRAYSEHLRSDYHQCAIRYKNLMREGEKCRVPECCSSSRSSRSSTHGYKCSYCDAFHRSREILNSHILSEHPQIASSVLGRR